MPSLQNSFWTNLGGRILAVAAAYFLAGWLGLICFAATPKITLIWLPTGIAVAALLRWGFACAPGIFLGQLAIALTNLGLSRYSLFIAAGTMMGSLVAAWLLQRFGFRTTFEQRRDILLLGLAGAMGMMVTAANGVVWLHLAGFVPVAEMLGGGLRWWVGDWLGVMTTAPVLLLADRREFEVIRKRIVEFAIGMAAICAAVWAIFVTNTGGWSLAFVPLPLIAWTGLRFGPLGNSISLLIVSIGAAYGTSVGEGPFKRHDTIGGIVALWIFMLTAIVLGWLITTLHNQLERDIAERLRTQEALKNSEEHLRTIVALDPECVALLSPEGLVREMNPAGLKLVEADSFDEIRGQSFAELLEPEQRDSFVALNARVLAGEVMQSEYTIVGRKGTRRWLEGHSLPYRNGTGAIAGILALARDVTRRKEAEQELQQSFSTLDLFTNSVPAFISYIDAELRYRLVNRCYEDYFGQNREQLIGQRVCDVQPPSAYAEMQPYIRRALAGEEIHFESNLLGPNGRRHWFDVRYTPRRGEDGVVLGFFVLVFDISERKQAEILSNGERTILEMLATGAPLRDSLTTLALSYEQMFPGILCSVLLLDAEGKRLRHGAAPSLPQEFCDAVDGVEIGPDVGSCGTAAYTLRTVLVDDIVTDPLWENYRDLASRYGLRACWSVPVLSSQGKAMGTFALYYRQPQKALPEEVAAIERGAHFAALAIERHQLLDSLRESQMRLETLISNLPGIAFRCLDDEHWTFLYVSEHCETITGYRREDLEGNRVISFENLTHPEDRAPVRANCNASFAAHETCLNEFRIIDRAGRERWVSERSTGVHDTAGALLYIDGFIQDITETRAAAHEREEFNRKVQETQKLESLGVLAGGIAHDFNNILTAILGNASLALCDAAPGTMLHDCLNDISNASLRASELCSQMLAYSGKGRFVVKNVDLNQLIQETTQMLQVSVSKTARLQFELGASLPAFEADATQIRQVIMNLVINASEAMPEGGGLITIQTGVQFMDAGALSACVAAPEAAEGDYVFLEVSDQGCGMSAETLARMFEPFFTTKFTGRGLGLAAVLGIVRGHGGALCVHSEPGRGTSFKVMFPASSGHAEARPEQPASFSAWRGQGTVLVVDDEAPVRATAARMLQSIGFETVLASDGLEAVHIFRETPERFTLVLLDLTMPNLSGEPTFVELNRIQPEVRVVLMSGYNEQEATLRFSGLGLKNFIQKPFAVDALRELLRNVLS